MALSRTIRDYQKLMQELKKEQYAPLYLLYGEEPYFIDQVAGYIESHALNEKEKAFNLTVLYGGETEPAALAGTLKRYPVNAPRQVVVLREAHRMRRLGDLFEYINNPVPTTVLVLCYKSDKLDRRTRFGKTITKVAKVLHARRLYDNQIPAWITEQVKDAGYRIDDKAVHLLSEYLGTDLARVDNELQKLFIKLGKDKPITPAHIEANIGISRDYNIFELQDALSSGDTEKTYRIIDYFAANPKANPVELVLASLYGYFSKIYKYHHAPDKSFDALKTSIGGHPFVIKKCVDAATRYSLPKTEAALLALHKTDLQVKGVGARSVEKEQLLKEMWYALL